MQSSKTGAGGSETPSKRTTTSTETFLPRGLSNAPTNGAGANGAGTNGKSRGENASYYNESSDHPLTSSYMPTNGGLHNASMYCATDPGNGIAGNYSPAFQTTHQNAGMPYATNTGSISMPDVPISSGSHYNPTLVPQASPYYPGGAGVASSALAGPTALVAVGNNSHHSHHSNGEASNSHHSHHFHGEAINSLNSHNTEGLAASYYSAPLTGISTTSTHGSTSPPHDLPPQQHTHSFTHSLEASIQNATTTLYNHTHDHTQQHSHNHNHTNPHPPLRHSLKKLWDGLQAEERYAVGQYELYSEITGVCAGCFTPGTSPVDAPRTHHYGQRWTSTGWRVKKKSTRRVWMRIFRRNGSEGVSSSEGTSSSNSSASVSDSELSENSRQKTRVLQKQIRREKRELRRLEREELREQGGDVGSTSKRRRNSGASNGSSVFQSTGNGAGKAWKNISGSGESDHRYIKTSTTHSATGVLRGGDLNVATDDTTVCYDPGYDGPEGQAHPKYYKTASKPSGVLGGWFGLSKTTNGRKKHQRTASQVSKASSASIPPGELFQFSSKSSSGSDDGQASGYTSSSSGSGSKTKKKSWFFGSTVRAKGRGRDKKEKKDKNETVKKGGKGKGKSRSSSSSSNSGSGSSSSSSSDDGMPYGKVYDSRKGSLDSASIRSKQSHAESVLGSRVSGAFGVGKMQRRKSWDDHYGTPGSTGRPGSAAVGVDADRRNSVQVTQSKTTTKIASQTAGSGSSWWGGGARKADNYSAQAAINEKHSTAASTQGGWFTGGSRKTGGWFGGSETVKKSTSTTSLDSAIGPKDTEFGATIYVEGSATQHSSDSVMAAKSYSTTDVKSSTYKAKEIAMQRQNSESRISTSGEEKRKEVWAQDSSHRERSPDRGSVMTGRSRRASSVDSCESLDLPRQSRSQQRRTSTTQKTTSTTRSTGFLSGLFSGRSETIRDRERSLSRESKRRIRKLEEAKRVEASAKGKGALYTTRDGRIIKEDTNKSNTYQVGAPKEEENGKLQKVYPMSTDNPLRFDITKPNPHQRSETSVARSSYTSEQLHRGQERQSAQSISTITTTAGRTEGSSVVAGGYTTVVDGDETRRPLPAPVQPMIPTQSTTIAPITTSTTTIINNHNTTHHTTSSSIVNNNSTSSSNIVQQAVFVASPLPTTIERTQSQSGTVGISATMAQNIAATAASAAAAQVASTYAKERIERDERERWEKETEREAQDRIQQELRELRLREEKAALERKEKSEREEKQSRDLRIAVEKKEREEAELRLKREREERAAEALKKKLEWEATERAKDEAARLSRTKQDQERAQQIRSEEERKYREWARLQTQMRLQRQKESDELFERTRKDVEETARQLESQLAIQKAAEEAKNTEAMKREKLETEVRLRKSEVEASETRTAEISKDREIGSKKIERLEEEKWVQVNQTNFNEKRLKDAAEIQRAEFLKEQERLSQQAKALEQERRIKFEAEIHSNKREVQAIEVQKVEIIEERKRTVEKLSKLEQIVAEASHSNDHSKVQEVQQQIRVEEEHMHRLKIEEEKKVAAQVELKRQEDIRVSELERQVRVEKERDAAALIQGRRIVAEETDLKARQRQEKVQQLDEQIRIEKEKAAELKTEVKNQALFQMEKERQKDEITRELIDQVKVEKEKETQVRFEEQNTIQIATVFKKRQEEEFRKSAQVAEERRVLLRKDEEKRQGESRRERQSRVEEQKITVAEEQRREAVQMEIIAREKEIEQQEWEKMTEEERFIHKEVQRRRELERQEEARIKLEQQAADLERMIAEDAARKEARRARSRARKADPEYREREARRSRERSKARETEGEKARRAEVELIRKNAGLDKEKKKEKKKKYSAADPLPTGDIPGFTEPAPWTVPFGVPTLIQTPPTPPPGTPMYPQVLHCQGSYFPRIAKQMAQNIVVSPDIFVVAPIESAPAQTSEFGNESRESVIRTETSSEFERRMEKMSSEASRSTESIAETQSVITGKPFAGTPIAPVPTLASGFNIGAAVIDHQQKEDSKRDQIEAAAATGGSAGGNTGSANGGGGFFKSVFSAAQTAASTIGNTITSAQQKESPQFKDIDYDQSQVIVQYGPELPPNFGSRESNAVYQASTKSDIRSQSTSERTSSDYNRQQVSQVVYGPELPPVQSSQYNTYTSSSDIRSQSTSERASSNYGRQQVSEVVYGPALPPPQAYPAYDARTTSSSQSTSEQSISGHGLQAQSPEVVYGPGLPPTQMLHRATSATVSSNQRSESSAYTRTSSDNRQESTSKVVYGPALPPAQTTSQSTYGAARTDSSSYERMSSASNRDKISSAVVAVQALSEVQKPHQSTYEEDKQSFRIPGGFDEEDDLVDVVREISRENQIASAPVVPVNRPALTSMKQSISTSSENIYSSQSASSSSTVLKEVGKEISRDNQTSSAPIYRPSIAGEKHIFSESSTALHSGESISRSISSISREQEFQTPPTSVNYVSTPPIYRGQPPAPNAFAFMDTEAASPPQTGRIVAEDGKELTREQKNKDNELMAAAAAAAEQAGFDVNLILGKGVSSNTAAVSRDTEIASVTRTRIVRPKSAFVEDIVDEDSAHIKRQLGQHELPEEAYWSDAETRARKESQSRTESHSRTESRTAMGFQSQTESQTDSKSPMPFSPSVPRFDYGTAVQPIEHPSQPPKPNPLYQVSTPKAIEWIPAHVPLPQPTSSAAVPPPPSQSMTAAETMAQERKNRAHGVERSAPPSRSASLSGISRSRMGSVREDGGAERPPVSRSASGAGSFRSRIDNAFGGRTEDSHSSTSMINDHFTGTETSDSRQGLERGESKRGRDQTSRNEQAARRGLDRRATDQYSVEGRPQGRQELQRRATDSQARDGQSLPRLPKEQWSVAKQLPEEHQAERRSRRSLEDNREEIEQQQVKESNEDEAAKSEAETLTKDKKVPKVSTWGKVFGWGGNRRSVSEAGGPRRPPDMSRKNTDDWETVTPPQKSRASSVRGMDSSYERIDHDNMSISSAPVALHDESVSHPSGWRENIKKTFESSSPQNVGTRPSTSASETAIPQALTLETSTPAKPTPETSTPSTPETHSPETERPKLKDAGRGLSSKAGLTGLFKAARQLKKAGKIGQQTPPRVVENQPADVPAVVRRVEETRNETSSDEYGTSSAGVRIQGEIQEQQGQVENTWDYSTRVDAREQRVAEHIPLPTPAAEDEEIKGPSQSRLPVSLKRKSTKSLRKVGGSGDLQQAQRRSGEEDVEEEAESGRSAGYEVVSDRNDGNTLEGYQQEFSESRRSLERKSAEQRSLNTQFNDRRPLQRSATEQWPVGQTPERQPLQRRLTEHRSTEGQSLPRSSFETIENTERQYGAESPSIRRLSRKSQSIEKSQNIDSQGTHIDRNDGNTFGGYQQEFSESRRSLERKSAEQRSLNSQFNDRQPLQRSSTEQWAAGQALDRQPLQRRLTEQYPTGGQSLSAVEATEGGEEQYGAGPTSSRLPVKKSQSIERKVKNTASPQAHAHGGEQVAKSLNCIEKPDSDLMLTLSEGVDLSSDLTGQQEDKQPSFEPPDIFDDRDSPPSTEKLPLNSPISPNYSPVQHDSVPYTFSFVSRTASPVSPVAVDIYEEYPALVQNNSASSPSITLEKQDTTLEKALVYDEVVPSLPFIDIPTSISTEANEPLPLLPQPNTSPKSRSPILQTNEPSIIAVEGSLSLDFTPTSPQHPSLIPPNSFTNHPVIPQQLDSLPLSGTSTYGPHELSEDLPPLLTNEDSIIVAQTPSDTPWSTPSQADIKLNLSEDQISTTEVTPVPTVLEFNPSPSNQLGESSTYVPVDIVESLASSLENEKSDIQVQESWVTPTGRYSEDPLPIFENRPPVTQEQDFSAPLGVFGGGGASEDQHYVEASLPLSPINEVQEPTEDVPLQANYPSSVDQLAGPALPLSSTEVERFPVDHQFSKGVLASSEDPFGSIDPRSMSPEDLRDLLEKQMSGMQHSAHDVFSLFTMPQNLSLFPQSTPQIPPHFQPKSLPLDSLAPVLESIEAVQKTQLSSHVPLVESRIFNPELYQLDQKITYNNAEDELPFHTMNDPASPAVVPEEQLKSSVPASPTTYPDPDIISPTLSGLVSNSVEQEVLTDLQELPSNPQSPSEETATGVLSPHSQPSSPPLLPSDLPEASVTLLESPASDASSPFDQIETSFEFPELPIRDHDSLSTILEELSESVVSKSPSIAAKEEYFTLQPMGTATTPVPNVVSEVPQDELFSTEQELPIVEHEYQAVTHSTPQTITVTVPNNVPVMPQEESLECQLPAIEDQSLPVPEEKTETLKDSLSTEKLDQSYEIISPVIETESVAQVTLSDSSESHMGDDNDQYVIPEFIFQHSSEHEAQQPVSIDQSSTGGNPSQELEVEDDTCKSSVEAPLQSDEDTIPTPEVVLLPAERPNSSGVVRTESPGINFSHELGTQDNTRQVSVETSLKNNEDVIPEPEAVSLLEERPNSTHVVATESEMVGGVGLDLQTHNSSTEYGIEKISPSPAIDMPQLPFVLEIPEDHPQEPEYLPQAEGVSIAFPEIPVLPAMAEGIEIDTVDRTETQSSEYMDTEESEAGSIARHISVEGVQLAWLDISNISPTSRLETLISSDYIPAPLPPAPVEPQEVETAETDEHLTAAAPANISMGSSIEEPPMTLHHPEETLVQEPLYPLPPVEVEGAIPNTKIHFGENAGDHESTASSFVEIQEAENSLESENGKEEVVEVSSFDKKIEKEEMNFSPEENDERIKEEKAEITRESSGEKEENTVVEEGKKEVDSSYEADDFAQFTEITKTTEQGYTVPYAPEEEKIEAQEEGVFVKPPVAGREILIEEEYIQNGENEGTLEKINDTATHQLVPGQAESPIRFDFDTEEQSADTAEARSATNGIETERDVSKTTSQLVEEEDDDDSQEQGITLELPLATEGSPVESKVVEDETERNMSGAETWGFLEPGSTGPETDLTSPALEQSQRLADQPVAKFIESTYISDAVPTPPTDPQLHFSAEVETTTQDEFITQGESTNNTEQRNTLGPLVSTENTFMEEEDQPILTGQTELEPEEIWDPVSPQLELFETPLSFDRPVIRPDPCSPIVALSESKIEIKEKEDLQPKLEENIPPEQVKYENLQEIDSEVFEAFAIPPASPIVEYQRVEDFERTKSPLTEEVMRGEAQDDGSYKQTARRFASEEQSGLPQLTEELSKTPYTFEQSPQLAALEFESVYLPEGESHAVERANIGSELQQNFASEGVTPDTEGSPKISLEQSEGRKVSESPIFEQPAAPSSVVEEFVYLRETGPVIQNADEILQGMQNAPTEISTQDAQQGEPKKQALESFSATSISEEPADQVRSSELVQSTLADAIITESNEQDNTSPNLGEPSISLSNGEDDKVPMLDTAPDAAENHEAPTPVVEKPYELPVSDPSTTFDKHTESILSEPTTETPVGLDISSNVDDTEIAAVLPTSPSAPQLELHTVEPSHMITHDTTAGTQQSNGDMEQLPVNIAHPSSPFPLPNEFTEEHTAVEQLQSEHTVTPVPEFENIQVHPILPASQSTLGPILASLGEEIYTPESSQKMTTHGLINQNQGGSEKLSPLPVNSEDTYQIHDEPGKLGVAPATTESRNIDNVPEAVVEELVSTGDFDFGKDVADKLKNVENKEPQNESVPMQASLSEGSKRKSKKARQREARRRKSLQGADFSSSSVVAAGMVRAPSIAEEPSGVSITTESSVKQSPVLPPVTAPPINETIPGDKEQISGTGLAGGITGEHMRTNDGMRTDMAQENLLPKTLETDLPVNAKTIIDLNESPVKCEPILTRSIVRVAPDSRTDTTKEAVKPVDEDLIADRLQNLNTSRSSLHSGLNHQTEAAKIGTEESLSEQVTEDSHPSADNFPMEKLEDLPALPSSEPSSRPGTPEYVVDLAPSESTTLRFPKSRQNRKIDVEQLRLPSEISGILSSDEGLPLLSPDPTADSEYLGGVSLQSGPDASHLSPEPSELYNGPNVSSRQANDPSLSSFGDGAVQAVPVAHVGLRGPMFPGLSPNRLSVAQPLPSQQGSQIDIDEFDESAYDPTGLSNDNSLPSINTSEPAKERGQEGAEGEEGIELEEGFQGSCAKTVITTFEEPAQSNDIKEFPSELPLSHIQFPISSEEAATVSKIPTINPYNTENAEDLSFKSRKNTLTLATPLSLDLKSSDTLLAANSTSTTFEQTPTLTRIAPPEHVSLPQGAPHQVPLAVDPTTPIVFQDLGRSYKRSSTAILTQFEGESANTYAPPSEISITPPPPLTHSSSFESAIEFWKHQIAIPTTTHIIPSPQLSPYATNSDTGVPLPTRTPQKSRRSSVQKPPPTSQPLDRKASGKSSDSNIVTESSVGTLFCQDQTPAITVEADLSYHVSVSPPPDDKKRQGSIEISVHKPELATSEAVDCISQRGSLHTQNSYDSLRTVINRTPSPAFSENDSILSKDLPSILEEDHASEGQEIQNTEPPTEGTLDKPYKSLFGGPRDRAISDPFVNKKDSNTGAQPSFQPPQKKLDSPFSYSEKPFTELPSTTDNLSSHTNSAYLVNANLPTAEQKSEGGTKPISSQSTTTERSFISADDLLARLVIQPVRKLTPIPDQSIINPKVRLPLDTKMDFLKRGERRRPAPPSLRRAGSQLESPNASSEHIILGGERTHTPENKGKGIRKADLYEAWGDREGEPKSPTRPPSIRRRQSMQIVDLENRLEGLAAENTNLTQEKANIEKTLTESVRRQKIESAAFTQELETRQALLTERDSEITELKKKLEYCQEEVIRLNQINETLETIKKTSAASYKFSYTTLAAKYKRKKDDLDKLTESNSELQKRFSEMQTTMENVIRDQLQEKDSELDRLRDELEKAREQVRKLQHQVSTRQDNKYLDTRDLRHFTSSCQQLFGSLKIWCNQFSSFSAGMKCLHVHRIPDEAARDRVEDVMLDDRGVRKMLKDERKRPEVFMAITIRMIYELVFSRYLFGLEVDERQKLVSLEKTLIENGEHEAVHQWRATTLTLLSTRPAFGIKRNADAESIVNTILDLLNYLLPPPSQYTNLARESLRNLIHHAVQLAIEMRTQRAEYAMKRPPRPEYDDNGDVTNSVPFKSSIMQNRGAEPVSDEDLEAEGATVKMILFPQVIRRGNEYGEDYDTEVTVLPMQVLVNRPQLRSESRASNKSVGATWRDDQQHAGVSRLTPITDQSPGDTPRTTPEKARIPASSTILPVIPEQTIRLVAEENTAGAYPSPSAEKKRRIDDW